MHMTRSISGRHVRAGCRHALLALCAWLCLTSAAMAHAALTGAVPPDGTVLQAAPETFLLSFSEPVSPLVLSLVKPDGSSVALADFALKDRTLTIEAPAALGAGTHVLSWRVVSEDGHPVSGRSCFRSVPQAERSRCGRCRRPQGSRRHLAGEARALCRFLLRDRRGLRAERLHARQIRGTRIHRPHDRARAGQRRGIGSASRAGRSRGPARADCRSASLDGRARDEFRAHRVGDGGGPPLVRSRALVLERESVEPGVHLGPSRWIAVPCAQRSRERG